MNIDLNELADSVSPNLGSNDVGQIVHDVVSDYILPAAGIAMFLYLLVGGYEIMTSAGNPKSIASGKGKITNAIVGFILVFIAYWVVQIVATIFGLQTILDIF